MPHRPHGDPAVGTGTSWFIEGDISDCFGSLNHEILLSILSENIHDNRFLRLIGNLMEAGYLEDWGFNRTLSGSPQGGVVNSMLSNVYLDRLDNCVEKTLLPEYNRGSRRRANPEYDYLKFFAKRLAREGDREGAEKFDQRRRSIPSQDPNVPDYWRLRYIRYADDFLEFNGPREEAKEIKCRLKEFLRDELKLDLSEEKTLITHARTEAARFLGYDLVVFHNDRKHDRAGRRCINGNVGL